MLVLVWGGILDFLYVWFGFCCFFNPANTCTLYYIIHKIVGFVFLTVFLMS